MANEKHDAVTVLLSKIREFAIPRDRTGIKPYYNVREYRGKWQWVVGYSWSRPYSHHMTGLVYDCVLAWGETFEAAMIRAKKRFELV